MPTNGGSLRDVPRGLDGGEEDSLDGLLENTLRTHLVVSVVVGHDERVRPDLPVAHPLLTVLVGRHRESGVRTGPPLTAFTVEVLSREPAPGIAQRPNGVILIARPRDSRDRGSESSPRLPACARIEVAPGLD